jgi:hypothetical protein
MARAAIGFFYFWPAAGWADERLWVEAKINGLPARLCFDTGTGDLVLLRAGAKRLGLKFTEPPTNSVLSPGEIPSGTTEACVLTIQDSTVQTQFRVADLPAYLRTDMDGLIGWAPVRDNILKIDAEAGTVTSLAKVPKAALGWLQLPVNKKSRYLQLEVPHDNGEPGSIFVDTGWTQGVALPEDKWGDWKTTHPLEPLTLKAFFMPGSGLLVKEEAWARQLSIGPLTLTNVPVTEVTPVHLALAAPPYEASLGLAGLKRLDFIVDGENGVAYLRPKKKPASPYGHSRLGAVFVPRDSQSDDLVARIVPGSPAEEVGIRNDDVLLRIDKLDVTKWRTDPKVLPLSRFWEQPPGTKLGLTLRRGEKVFQVKVMLREILSPKGAAGRASSQETRMKALHGAPDVRT